MSELFLNVVGMSVSAGVIVLAVLLLRLPLKKAPKWITVLLWSIAAFRLVCPVTVDMECPTAQLMRGDDYTNSQVRGIQD